MVRANSKRTPEWWAKVFDLRGGIGLTLSQQRELLLDYEACSKQVLALETAHRTEQDEHEPYSGVCFGRN